LNISVKTVEKNVTAIYAKLGITRRVQLHACSREARSRSREREPARTADAVHRRADELADVHERTRRNRLLSLVGPGGSGKSRLACELARREAGTHADGTWFVDLTTIADANGMWPLLAVTLGIARDPQRSLDATVVAWLAKRAVLFVLDNAEHLLPAFGRAVHALLQAGPACALSSPRASAPACSARTSFASGQCAVPTAPRFSANARPRPARPSLTSGWPKRSAIASTAFRWRSNSPPRASTICRSKR